MRLQTAILAFALAPLAWGGAFFQRAAVTSMQTTDCVTAHRSIIAALSGTTDTHRDLCAEYVLVSATTIFRVQASKLAPLLLPPEEVNFRPGKGALILRRDDQQDDFEVKVVCMQLRNSKEENCATLENLPTVAAKTPR